MKIGLEGGYWIYIRADEPNKYEITGKYLLFSSDKDRLIEIAKNEIEHHGFHVAKVNSELIGSNTEHVLCLYYKDDSRKYELADRHKKQYSDVKYRYWKSDADTLSGKYSEEFLSKVGARRDYFTSTKTRKSPR